MFDVRKKSEKICKAPVDRKGRGLYDKGVRVTMGDTLGECKGNGS